MQYIVLSDIHGNAPALETVLRDAPPFDAVICLGDLVGYGPNPALCIERVQDFDLTCIAGNHDWGVVGRTDMYVFNREARHALIWTQQSLSEAELRFLSELSPKQALTDGILLSHGSPRDPVWEYLVDTDAASQNFDQFGFDLALVGHSHLPVVFEWHGMDDVEVIRPQEDVPMELEGRRLILNPGSVGQPRDGNPKASYAYLDLDAMTWTFRRVTYPVEITQERMRAQELPRRLIDRLELGR